MTLKDEMHGVCRSLVWI